MPLVTENKTHTIQGLVVTLHIFYPKIISSHSNNDILLPSSYRLRLIMLKNLPIMLLSIA